MPTTDLPALRAHLATSPDHLAALDDLVATIAAQALIIRNLSMRLRNAGIASAQLDALGGSVLDSLAATLRRARPAPISLAAAEHAAGELADTLARRADLAATLTTIARIVAVFV